MFGYCAMGNWNMATRPTITMRIEMTIATMCRLMKNLAMALARPLGLGQRGFDLLAGFHSVDSLDDDPLARLQPLPDDPEGADALADLDGSKVHRLVASDHGDLVDALLVQDSPLRNEQRAFFRVADGAHLLVLAGAQEVARVWEHSPDADGAGRRPDRAVQDRDRPSVGVNRSVGEGDLEIILPLAVTAAHKPALPQSQILLLADGELDVDRVDQGDRGENRAGADLVPDVRVLDAGDAGDRGEDLRPAVVELGIVQHGPGLGDVRPRLGHTRLRVREARAGGLQRGQIRQVGLHRVVQLLLADRAAVRQRSVAGDGGAPEAVDELPQPAESAAMTMTSRPRRVCVTRTALGYSVITGAILSVHPARDGRHHPGPAPRYDTRPASSGRDPGCRDRTT